jgi:hypothetical protein
MAEAWQNKPMTQTGVDHKKRNAYMGVLVVVALSLIAFFARLGLGISFGILAVGLIAVGIWYALGIRKRPARDN